MNEKTKEWIKFAKSDINAFKQLNAVIVRKENAIICFLAQQAAEKMLKAVIQEYIYPEEPLKTHDLSELLFTIEKFTSIDDSIHLFCAKLKSYVIKTRYPGGEEIEETDSKIAIKYCKSIIDWCNNKIKEFENIKQNTKARKPSQMPERVKKCKDNSLHL